MFENKRCMFRSVNNIPSGGDLYDKRLPFVSRASAQIHPQNMVFIERGTRASKKGNKYIMDYGFV